MKKLLIIFLLAAIATGAWAQDKKLVATKVKKGDEPKAVVDAIEEDFPSAITDNFAFLPYQLYGEEWNVRTQGMEDTGSRLYQVEVKLKEGNKTYTAVYDKDGNLKSSKEVIKSAELPAVITASLKSYEGWRIDKSTELITYKKQELKQVYKVKLQKGAEHKVLFFDGSGRVVNERLAIL